MRWTLLALSLTLCGCGDSSTTTTFGRVTWNGQPVAQGQIRFVPANGPTIMGTIQDGGYRLSGANAVPVGTSRVEIDVMISGDSAPVASLINKDSAARQFKQVAPPRFNTESKLEARIVAGKDNEHNFSLEP
jgi:hypothetical protein